MRAVLERHRLPSEEAQIQFVDDGVRFEGVVAPFVPQHPRRELAKLGVHDGEQLIASRLVAGSPTRQARRDLYCRGLHQKPVPA
jgi:hypothetical protein